MSDHDWEFLMGDFGDPLADIEDWMLPPRPLWIQQDITDCSQMKITYEELQRRLANGPRHNRT